MNAKNALSLHRESIIVDGLNASWFLSIRVLEDLQLGGVTAVNATIAAWHDVAETMGAVAALYALLRDRPTQIMQIGTVADIATAKATERVGLIFGFQDTRPIGADMNMLGVYHRLGVRIIQLTYNHRNRVGSGCLEPEDKGLTDLGRAVVEEMNRLGILIDLSHCGPRTTWETIEQSQQPVAFTHANPSSRCPNPRNKSDELLRALAARGGVVGAVAFPPLTTCTTSATLDDYLDTIDCLVTLVGIDHVGLGPDFMAEMPPAVAAAALQGMNPEAVQQFSQVTPTAGFASIAACTNVTQGLLDRGYTAADVQKIMGGNWLRLYGEVW